MTLAAGDRLGPYEINRPLGAGGMGEVFSARDGRLGREVAIKVLPARFADDPERKRRFEQEARATAALSHRNILAIFDVGTHDGCPYLVEELLRGESLRERLGRGAIPEREAVAIAAAITAGLGAAHQAGIVHRDLKPENVFLTRDGEVKVLDFGLAKLLLPSDGGDLAEASTLAGSSRAGVVLGTLGYMAPEQLRGQAVDARADLFALGCVLYEMLSGQRAFARGTGPDCLAAILREEPPPLDGLAPQIPPALQAIVTRCLAKRPEDRFDSARDLALALEGLTTEHAPPPTRAPRRLRGVAVAGVAGALVVALGLVATVIVRRHGEAEWAREHGLPEIMRLVDAHDTWAAFLLARRVATAAPDDQLLAQLWPQFAAEIVWQVTPAGATIFARDPRDPAAEWVLLGESGGTPLRTPTGCTVFRVEHPESEPLEFAMSLTYSRGTIPLVLRAAGEQPAGMVRVDPPEDQTTDFPSLFAYGAGPLTSQIGSFLVDSREVTSAGKR